MFVKWILDTLLKLEILFFHIEHLNDIFDFSNRIIKLIVRKEIIGC